MDAPCLRSAADMRGDQLRTAASVR